MRSRNVGASLDKKKEIKNKDSSRGQHLSGTDEEDLSTDDDSSDKSSSSTTSSCTSSSFDSESDGGSGSESGSESSSEEEEEDNVKASKKNYQVEPKKQQRKTNEKKTNEKKTKKKKTGKCNHDNNSTFFRQHKLFEECVLALFLTNHVSPSSDHFPPSKTCFIFREEDILGQMLEKVGDNCPQLIKNRKKFMDTVERIVFQKDKHLMQQKNRRRVL